jgi:hypothetical protein
MAACTRCTDPDCIGCSGLIRRRHPQPRTLDAILLELAQVCRKDHEDVIERELARIAGKEVDRG